MIDRFQQWCEPSLPRLKPDNPSWASIRPRVARWYERFYTQRESQVIMEFARRGGLTFSEAAERLEDPDDLAAEMAWDVHQSIEDSKRCAGCGVNHASLVDGDSLRPIESMPFVPEQYHCYLCESRAKETDAMEDQLKSSPAFFKAAQHVRMVPWSADWELDNG